MAPSPAENLDINHVRYYLESHRWTRVAADDDKELWQSVDSERTVLLPRVRLADFGQLMSELLVRVAADEGTEPDEVLLSLSWPGYDKLVARTHVGRATPAVPLTDAIELNYALRDLVVSAARAAEAPQATYTGGWSNAVTQYIDSVLMIPSQAGSYALRALLPTNVDPPDTMLFQDIATPSIRAVTTTLMIAANSAVTAATARASGQDLDVFDDVVAQGVSAGFLDALARLGGTQAIPDPFELRLVWTYGGPDTWEPLHVPAGLVPVLEQGAEHLRGPVDDVEAVITGTVVTLHRDQALGPGEVTVDGFVDAGTELANARKVRMELDEQTYASAIAAHQSGAVVKVRATVRLLRRVEVQRVSDFSIVVERST